jgi:trans-aconitate methyltransferase
MAPYFKSNFNINNPLDVLILGFGAGTYAKECHNFFPNSRIDGVEIDRKIINISKQYFGLTDQDARIFLNDGRAFLLTPNARKYDLILVDAYHDITIPFHMSTREFFGEVKKHLKKDGVLAININIHSSTNTELIDHFTQTVRAEFGKVYRCDIESLSNSMIIASDNPDCLNSFLKNSTGVNISYLLYPHNYYVRTHLREITESRLVFTDEVAPVEIMGQKVLDEYVKEGLSYFTSRLKNSKNKFQELLNIVSEN